MIIENATLFKYVSGENYHIESIENNYFYFSRIKEVNDPDDCIVSPTLDMSTTTIYDAINFFTKYGVEENETLSLANMLINNKTLQQKYVNDYRKTEKLENERFRNKIKILCLTDNPVSLHMWENYAKKNIEFDGFCMGFQCSPNHQQKIVEVHKCFNVPLQPGQIQINGISVNQHVATQVFYGNNELVPYNPFKGNKNDLTFSYYYKKENYKDEEEYRCVLSDSMTFNTDIQKIKFNPQLLTTIIFGMNSTNDLIDKVKKAVDSNSNYIVNYYKAKNNNVVEIEKF